MTLAILVMSFQVSYADQKDPIECELTIYCTNPSNGFNCGLLGDSEEDGKIEIVRRHTAAVYTATYSQAASGIQVQMKVKEGSYYSEISGLLNSQNLTLSLPVANTSFICSLK